jgi:hypothetical protein
MRHLWRTVSIGALTLGAACSGSKTETPVITKTATDQSVSPAGTETAERGKSLIRVVNALPKLSPIDLTAGDTTMFQSVGYKTVTPYTEIQDNVVNFKLRGAGQPNALTDNTETMMDGYRYTVVALPSNDGGAKLRILRDEVAGDPTKARLRVVHAAPGMGSVDVAAQGNTEPIFHNVAYGSEAGYRDIEPMSAVLEVRRDGGSRLIRLEKMQFEAGKAYTIVIAGSSTRVEAITFDDSVARS